MEPNAVATAVVSSSGAEVWGTLAGAVVVAFYFIDKFLSNRKGENVTVKALTEDNARLENRLREEKQRADENEDRADSMASERNALIREFAEIKSSHAQVLERLDWLSKQNVQLIDQNKDLTKRLNEFLNRGNT